MKSTNPKDALGTRKVPISPVPLEPLLEAGLAMLDGALKYGKFNYHKEKVLGSVYADAIWRHFVLYLLGQDVDPKTQVSHLGYLIASACILRDAQLNGMLIDDRQVRTVDPEIMEHYNSIAARLVNLYADCKPEHYTRATEQPD